MFIEARTPGPDPRDLRFRADRVTAVRGAPGGAGCWAELLFVGGGESVVVDETAAAIAERIAEVVEAVRR